jgi:hypothetical protein
MVEIAGEDVQVKSTMVCHDGNVYIPKKHQTLLESATPGFGGTLRQHSQLMAAACIMGRVGECGRPELHVSLHSVQSMKCIAIFHNTVLPSPLDHDLGELSTHRVCVSAEGWLCSCYALPLVSLNPTTASAHSQASRSS